MAISTLKVMTQLVFSNVHKKTATNKVSVYLRLNDSSLKQKKLKLP